MAGVKTRKTEIVPKPAKTGAGGLRAKGGAIITAEMEAVVLAEAEAGYPPEKLTPRKAPGRPSLSTGGGTSHRINVRVDDEIYEVIQQVARDTGRRPSELIREVLRAAYGPKRLTA